MVETREGLEQVEEIAATPGLSGIYVGVTDIAMSLGLGPRAHNGHEQHGEALERIRRACQAVGVAAGIHCHGGREARERAAQGFRLITVASDFTLIRASAARELMLATAGAPEDPGSRAQQPPVGRAV
jgi:4-hydroxy-2-oxoheptanedioate aldolase